MNKILYWLLSEFLIDCKTKATAKPNANAKCVFPFTFENIKYTHCTVVGNYFKPWCATKANFTTKDGWGDCDLKSCKQGMYIIITMF